MLGGISFAGVLSQSWFESLFLFLVGESPAFLLEIATPVKALSLERCGQIFLLDRLKNYCFPQYQTIFASLEL